MILAAREKRIGPTLVKAPGMKYEDNVSVHTEEEKTQDRSSKAFGLAGGKGA